jgi:hypothetical protein
MGVARIKWAGLKAGPFQGRQAAEENFAGASEASGSPCGESFLVGKARATTPDIFSLNSETLKATSGL